MEQPRHTCTATKLLNSLWNLINIGYSNGSLLTPGPYPNQLLCYVINLRAISQRALKNLIRSRNMLVDHTFEITTCHIYKGYKS